jgi:nicotinamidase-related amidase
MSRNTALVIIDVQMGMFDEDEPVYNGEKLLQTLSGLIDRARQTDVQVVYIQHNNKRFVEGGPAWPIHPSVTPLAGDVIVQKRTPDSFHKTNLGDELEKLGIKHLVVGGIQTEYCVDTTCRRAHSLGYDITLVEDGHSTWDNKHITAEQVIAHHNATLDGWAVTLKPAKDIQFD